MARPRKALTPKPQGSKNANVLTEYYANFWGIGRQTQYNWRHAGWDLDNLPELCRTILRDNKLRGASKKKARETLDALRAGESVEYAGKVFTNSDLGLDEPVNIPKTETDFDKLSPAELEAIIAYHGKRMSLAMATNNIDDITTFQPLYLRAVECKDKNELAAKKLGIDTLEMIPREKFLLFLEIILWAQAQKVEAIACKAAKAAAGKPSLGETYEAIIGALWERMIEHPLVEITTGSAAKIGLPEWVHPEMLRISKSYVQDAERRIKLYKLATKRT